MLADLSGRVAVVTGGGQGLGLGIVMRMAEQGADIAIADLSEENAAKAADKVRALGRKAYTAKMDVTDKASAQEAIKKILSDAGQIDILVNNAGVAGAPGSTGVAFRDIDWEFTWKVNVKGLADVTEAVLPHMRERRYGKIINISSVAARAARYVTAYYATTKMAVIAYTQALAREFAAENINANAIAPGRIWTAFHQDWMAEREKLGDAALAGKDRYQVFETAARQVIPLGRPQTPSDIGALAAFLASDDASNITGQTIQCDGGQVMV
ncbi:MAG: SDR family NAD(P)-dependent oxidoreductase [Chloroflexi bacterium]|nr:SDR family NAD(P)-dependent oxidoreductase [Chloroflexota bacterium]